MCNPHIDGYGEKNTEHRECENQTTKNKKWWIKNK